MIRTKPRFATHDGFIPSPEPPPRHLMTDREAIITRLAKDMLDIKRVSEFVMSRDLHELGWTADQVRVYRLTAADRADEIASGARA